MQRNLDGVFFRIRRNDKWENICWTDLTDEERSLVSKERPIEWWQGLTEILTHTLVDIGNQLDLYASLPSVVTPNEAPGEEPVVVEEEVQE